MWCVRRIGGQIFAKQGPVLRVGLLALSLEAGFLQAAHLADFGNGRVRFGLYSELYSAGNKFQLQAGAYVQPCPAHPEATQFYAGDGDVIVLVVAAGVVQGLDADAGGLAHVKLAPGEFGRRGIRPGIVHGGPPTRSSLAGRRGSREAENRKKIRA